MSIKQRLEKNLKRLSSWAKSANYEAYRLYEKDIPEYPFIIDLYKDYALVYEQGKKIATPEEEELRQRHWSEVTAAILEVLKISEDRLIFKKREIQERTKKYLRLDQSNEMLIVNEGQFKFYVNLWDYLDTGLFLDHRPLRANLRKRCHEKRVLNLFAYTCSLSVAAAIGHATQVVSVDLSNNYLDWGHENFKLNGINTQAHSFINDDVLDFLKRHNERYDLILLDPPTFSNSKKMERDFDVQEDQHFLVTNCMRLLNPNGILIFSTNRRDFKLDPKIGEKYNVKVTTENTIPLDFRSQKIHHSFEITVRS